MTQTALNHSELKQLLKEVFTETLQEQRGVLHEVFTDVLEDVCLSEAVKEGLQTEPVNRNEVFDILDGRT